MGLTVADRTDWLTDGFHIHVMILFTCDEMTLWGTSLYQMGQSMGALWRNVTELQSVTLCHSLQITITEGDKVLCQYFVPLFWMGLEVLARCDIMWQICKETEIGCILYGWQSSIGANNALMHCSAFLCHAVHLNSVVRTLQFQAEQLDKPTRLRICQSQPK